MRQPDLRFPEVLTQARSGGAASTKAAVTGALVLAILAAWAITIRQMRGMDAGPGTDLGTFGWFIGVWVTMTAAMMLPSAAPTALLFSRFGRGAQTMSFVAGYLLAWTMFGTASYLVSRLIHETAPSAFAWDHRGPWIAGAALTAAGLYQLTPIKNTCLRHCRSPLHYLLRGRPGLLGAGRAGLGHGAYCVGCCAGLMIALFALGIMSVFWMAVAAAVILVEKTFPAGEWFSRALAVMLIVLGAWLAISPASVPRVHEPAQVHRDMGMQQ